jgi:hypothetical protein
VAVALAEQFIFSSFDDELTQANAKADEERL